MIDAILYIEFEPDYTATEDMLKISLMNCLQLVFSVPNGGFIVHLACNDPQSLSQAINNDLIGIEGISQITTCVVRKR
jgi:hypothetical protein